MLRVKLLFFAAASVLLAQTPDLILLNGKIWTVAQSPAQAEAVACSGGKIVAVGATADIRKLAGGSTRVIDLGGKRVVPGFNDAHVHFFQGGSNLAGVQL